ncbi:MAG: SMP-30/gluconolactonase/LRE family protein [Syntrophothermus sp.]
MQNLINVKNILLLLLFILPASFIRAQSPVLPGENAVKVAGGFQFVEGPLWKDGLGLLFSDINANTIYLLPQNSGTASAYLRNSGGANGLAFDKQGRLLFAQQGGRKLMRLEPDGKQTILAEFYLGKRLNSPNDIAVKSDGAIFFTDPPYGISSSQAELGFNGVYRLSPAGELQVLEKTISRPNGICFSPNEKVLYVSDAENRRIFAYDIVNDSLLANKRQFAAMAPSGYTDGMKVDSAGNLFATGPLGVWVYSPKGTVLDTILVPGQVTNCNWGDADRKTLYITSGTNVYKIRCTNTAQTAVEENHGKINRKSGAVLNSPVLYDNYPNPFNPSTTIYYKINDEGSVRLKVFDTLGNEIRTLVSEFQKAGDYRVRFNAGGLSSGVYFCRLEAGGLFDIKKLVLAK